jgi:hypothetical protein
MIGITPIRAGRRQGENVMPHLDCAEDIESQEGDTLCSVCAPDEYTLCDGCAEWIRTNEDCARECVLCGGCGTWLLDGDSCDDCVTCARCHDSALEEQTIETVRGSTICHPCSRRYYWQCDQCDGWNRDGNNCANDCCSDHCDCSDCGGDDDDDDSSLIRSYDYQPRPEFHGDGPLYVGVEIEIATPDGTYESARLATDLLGTLGYLKADSSISRGFEIVTHPMSYAWAREYFPWALLTELSNGGALADDSTGIHVHVSKAGFKSACHSYRWMKFIYRNQKMVTTLARRESQQWAAFRPSDRSAVKDYVKGAYGDRYRAINTNNSATYELRMFASSLNPREVLAAIGFAVASVEYTRSLTAHDIAKKRGWEWSAFVEWLEDSGDYAPLLDELKDFECAS